MQVFNTFWHGESLSAVEKVCMESFIKHNHFLRVFTYSKAEMPAGVILEDAAVIMPRDRVFTFQESPSAFSNIFRYKLLLERGGWWVDTDILCLGREIPDCDYYWAREVPGKINGAILKFPPGDPMCWRLLRLSEERSKNLTQWGQLGPDLLTKVLSNYTPTRLCGSTEDVYPIHWLETHFFWLPEFLYEVEERLKNSTFVHLWHSMFKRMGMNPNLRPPRGSFLSKLYKQYELETCENAEAGSCRESIRRYLEQDWSRQYWSNDLGRDVAGLYPLQEKTHDQSAQLHYELQKAIESNRELEEKLQISELRNKTT
jgi:hypothetical protein